MKKKTKKKLFAPQTFTYLKFGLDICLKSAIDYLGRL